MVSKNATIDQTGVATTLAKPFVWLYSAIIGVFLVLVWMLLVDLWFMHGVWPRGQRLETVAAILVNDLAAAPRPLADRVGDMTYAAIFRVSGLEGAITAATTPGAKLSGADETLIRVLVAPYGEEIAIVTQSARLLGVRLAILLQVFPVGMVAIGTMLVDGLVQRYIRREGAGRESANLYHRAKYLQLVGGLLVGMLYVTVPVAIDPRWLFAWVAMAAFLAFLQAKYYKKYL